MPNHCPPPTATHCNCRRSNDERSTLNLNRIPKVRPLYTYHLIYLDTMYCWHGLLLSLSFRCGSNKRPGQYNSVGQLFNCDTLTRPHFGLKSSCALYLCICICMCSKPSTFILISEKKKEQKPGRYLTGDPVRSNMSAVWQCTMHQTPPLCSPNPPPPLTKIARAVATTCC